MNPRAQPIGWDCPPSDGNDLLKMGPESDGVFARQPNKGRLCSRKLTAKSSNTYRRMEWPQRSAGD
jgi:hypothetical protein